LDTGLNIGYNFKSETYVLSSEYGRLLIKIAGEVALVYEESKKK